MVHRAQRADIGVGGHISTYAGAATLYEVGFNHFFRGKDHPGGGDQVFFQGHASPGMYARAFMEGRLSEEDLDGFRQEKSKEGHALSSYPHPRLMPEFWEFPTVSMGIGPMNAIYQAQSNRYLHNRGIKDTSDQQVWAFLGDGEMDEPESRGLLQLAANDKLDNLNFVINCNLQRLDGPVRGNGKIMQELEAFFRGAGWNVIKVVWGREWDDLLAKDEDGSLVKIMNETVDGDYQTYKAESGAFVREHFFGKTPQTKEMVQDLSDDEIWNLKRGGHDYNKVYAAYKAATEFKGKPTVILAHTVKGYGLGTHFEGRNATHQMKKLTLADLKAFRDHLRIPITDEQLEADLYRPPYYHPGMDSPEIQYLMEPPQGNSAASSPSGAPSTPRSPCRMRRPTRSPTAAPASSRPPPPWRSSACSRTSCGTRSSASGSCRSSRTRHAPSAWTRSSRRRRSTTRTARTTSPWTASSSWPTRSPSPARSCTPASTRPAPWQRSPPPAPSYATHGEPLIPVYVFYSMFGFQRTGDSFWAAADQMTRGFIIGATAGRTTLTGEGLQHADGHSPMLAATNPAVVTYDPAYGYEIGRHHARRPRADVRARPGRQRPVAERDVLHHRLQRADRPAGRHRRNSTSRASSRASTCWRRPRSTARARRSSPPVCRFPGPSKPSGSSPRTGASRPTSGP